MLLFFLYIDSKSISKAPDDVVLINYSCIHLQIALDLLVMFSGKMLSVTCKYVFQYLVFSMGFDARQVLDEMFGLLNREISPVCLVFGIFVMLLQFLLPYMYSNSVRNGC